MKNAIDAQRDLSIEIDNEAAKIIREQGIPLFDAVEIARKTIRQRRQRATSRQNSKELFSICTNQKGE